MKLKQSVEIEQRTYFEQGVNFEQSTDFAQSADFAQSTDFAQSSDFVQSTDLAQSVNLKQRIGLKKLTILLLIFCMILFAGCGEENNTVKEPENKLITVGFSQIGAESDWRRSNTESMKQALSKENGFNLIYMNGQQKQTNQIMAVRTFIQQGVDYIVLAPVKEEGFSTVLREAKDAHIPVIIVDRMVEVDDPSLFTCFVGSDFELEGLKMIEWIHSFAEEKGLSGKDLKIVNIQGTAGSSAQLGRSNGLEIGINKYGWDLLGVEIGDYTQTKGREVMKEFLENYPELNVVYCENDNMAFGAIEAIEEAGLKVGTDIANGDILVLSFDGVSKNAIELVKNGKIACIAECNPLHGPRVANIINRLVAGEQVEKISYVDESMFAFSDIIKTIVAENQEYEIRNLGSEKEDKE
ncbi:MAG: ABC transporter substrate-binding protein [Lachnospiraceae bacterium]|nr:ABC transporter substrate-binding protein [Lachnospiraceae bacterium]